MFKNINSIISQSKHTSNTCQITKSSKLSELTCSLATAFHPGNKNKGGRVLPFVCYLTDNYYISQNWLVRNRDSD